MFFDGLPLHTPLILRFDFYAGSNLVYSSLTKQFTLTSTDLTELELTMYRERNTPIALHTIDGSGNPDSLYISAPDTPLEGYPDEWESWNIQDKEALNYDYYSSPYAFDDDGNLWYLYYGANSEDAKLRFREYGSSSYTELIGENYASNSSTGSFPFGIVYDADTGKLCIIGYDRADEKLEFCSITPAALTAMSGSSFTELFNAGFKCDCKSWDVTQDLPLFTAGNGFLFMYDGKTCRKFSTATGSLVKENICELEKLPEMGGLGAFLDALPSSYNKQSQSMCYDENGASYKTTTVNDMTVYQDSLIILFTQMAEWDTHLTLIQPENIQAGDQYGIVSRGGILTLDADTLTKKNIIGLEDLHDGFEQQMYLSNKYNLEVEGEEREYFCFIELFEDSALTKPLLYSWPVTWAVSSSGTSFCSPVKIVAIKPKKLIIADSGVFMYRYSDFLFNNGTVGKDARSEPRTSCQRTSRLVTIDLEAFSILPEESVDSTGFFDSGILSAFEFSLGSSAKIGDERTFYGPTPVVESVYRLTPNESAIVEIRADYNTPQSFSGSQYTMLAPGFKE